MQILRLFILLCTILISGCTPTGNSGEKARVLVTTGMIGDAVKYLLGNTAEVDILMGPGVDPHLYKASQGDMRRISEARLLVVNGLHLEGKMTETFERLAETKPVIFAGKGIPTPALLPIQGSKNLYDPHIWLDVARWSEGVAYIGRQLCINFTEDSAVIRQRLNTYLDSLGKLDKWCRLYLNEIQPDQRVLITSHDAFQYFGRAYGFKVKGLQGISTVSEYGLRDIREMVNFICDRKIKAVFVESSVPEQSIRAVIEGCQARGHQLNKGGTLFSDAVGADGSYFSMVRHNVATIKEALSQP